jgi:hypothetical protein
MVWVLLMFSPVLIIVGATFARAFYEWLTDDRSQT